MMSKPRKTPAQDDAGTVDVPPGTVHRLSVAFNTHYDDGTVTVSTDYVRAYVDALPAEIAAAIFAEGEPGHTLWKDLITEVNQRLAPLTGEAGSPLLRLRRIIRDEDHTAIEFDFGERVTITDLHRLHYGAAMTAGALEQVTDEWAAAVRALQRARRLSAGGTPQVTP